MHTFMLRKSLLKLVQNRMKHIRSTANCCFLLNVNISLHGNHKNHTRIVRTKQNVCFWAKPRLLNTRKNDVIVLYFEKITLLKNIYTFEFLKKKKNDCLSYKTQHKLYSCVRIIFVSRMLFLGPKRAFMLRNMLLYLGR